MNKFIFLIIVFFLAVHSSGCGRVTGDYTFIPKEKTEDWRLVFSKGYQESVKQAPVPDKAKLTFNSENLSIEILAGYTQLKSVGVFWLPIVPYSSTFSKDDLLSIEATISSKSAPIVIDCSKISIFVNNDNTRTYNLVHLYSSQPVNYLNKDTNDEYPVIEVASLSSIKILIQADIKATKVETFKLIIDGMTINGRQIEIPTLDLKKKKGFINYDEFTL